MKTNSSQSHQQFSSKVNVVFSGKLRSEQGYQGDENAQAVLEQCVNKTFGTSSVDFHWVDKEQDAKDYIPEMREKFASDTLLIVVGNSEKVPFVIARNTDEKVQVFKYNMASKANEENADQPSIQEAASDNNEFGTYKRSKAGLYRRNDSIGLQYSAGI